MLDGYTPANLLHVAARVNSREELVDVKTSRVLDFKAGARVGVAFGPYAPVDRQGYSGHGKWHRLNFLPSGPILKVERKLPERVEIIGALLHRDNRSQHKPYCGPVAGALTVLEDVLKM